MKRKELAISHNEIAMIDQRATRAKGIVSIGALIRS
jgi:hypothetical protein